MKKKMALATLLAYMLMFTAASIALAQSASDPFTGRWIIKDAKLGGNPFKDDLDCSVTIETDGRYYYVSGLDDRSMHISFTRQGNSLEGDYLADINYLTSNYPSYPQSVLSQAVGKISYHCTIVFDGKGLTARSDNATIHRIANGPYQGYTPYKGYYEWYLTRAAN